MSARHPSATMPSGSSPTSTRGRHPHHGHARSINRCHSLLGSTGPHRALDLPPPVAPNMNTHPKSCRTRSRARRSSRKNPDRGTTWIMDATTHHPEPPYRPRNILGRSPTPSPLPSSDDMPSHPDAAPVHPELERDADLLPSPGTPPAMPNPIQPTTLIQTFNTHIFRIGHKISSSNLQRSRRTPKLATHKNRWRPDLAGPSTSSSPTTTSQYVGSSGLMEYA